MPPVLHHLIARIRSLFRGDAVAGEIHDELEFHLKMRVEEYERNGFSKEEARRLALSRVGNIAVHQDRGYDVRGGGFIETVLQDVRYTLRLWRKQPGFAAVAILTLAFGIGVSTALFSVIDAALLQPLPFPHPEQLVSLRIEAPDSRGELSTTRPSLVDARDWRTSHSLAAVGVMREFPSATIVDAGAGPERVDVSQMGEGCMEMYQRAMAIGRALTESDVAVGAPRVVLLGYGYWQSRFGGAADAIGRTIRFMNEEPATIIGVLPQGFYSKSALWLPHRIPPNLGAGKRGMGTDTYARMRAGTTVVEVERELTEVARRIAAERGQPIDLRVKGRSLLSESRTGYGSTINLLSYAVTTILLIACINVAGLLLARGAARRPELAIRASIGAGRARLIRQLLTESAVLAIAGGLMGTLLAWLSLDALVSIVPLQLPAASSAALNMTVLGFTLALSLITVLFFGLMPAFKQSRPEISSGMHASRQHASSLSRRSGQLLIGAEVALAIVLLSGAGLLVKSLSRALAVDVGFDPASVITMEVTPIDQTPEGNRQYYASLLDAIRALPGVAAVSAIDNLPMGNSMTMTSVQVDGRHRLLAVSRQPLPDYLEAIGQTVKQGRMPSREEMQSSTPVAVINEEAAKRLFNGDPAVGQVINVPPRGRHEIVAVVANIRQHGPLSDAGPEIITFTPGPITRALNVVIRPVKGRRIPTEQLRQIAQGVGPKVMVERIRTGSDWVDDSIVNPRRRTLLFSLLGGLGLVLTLVGIFGTTAYAVSRRTQEIGVRMAFGARPGQVVRAIVSDAAWPIAVGTVIGLGGALLSTKVIAKFLFQTTPTDPATFAGVAIVLGIAGGLAAWLPARRAARIDPVAALRAE